MTSLWPWCCYGAFLSQKKIFWPHTHLLVTANGPGMLLQQDNARPHVARLVTQHLANANIQHLKWPFVSPDLSPIEHMWDELECRLRQRDNQPQSMLELSDALIEEWDNIPMDRVQKLIISLRRRCQTVVSSYGGHTRLIMTFLNPPLKLHHKLNKNVFILFYGQSYSCFFFYHKKDKLIDYTR